MLNILATPYKCSFQKNVAPVYTAANDRYVKPCLTDFEGEINSTGGFPYPQKMTSSLHIPAKNNPLLGGL